MSCLTSSSRCCASFLKIVKPNHRVLSSLPFRFLCLRRSSSSAVKFSGIGARKWLNTLQSIPPAGQAIGSVRHYSGYDTSDDLIEIPDDLREDLIEYARKIAPQHASLVEWSETVLSQESLPVRQRREFNRALHFLGEVVDLLEKYDQAHAHIVELTEMLTEPDLAAIARKEIVECKNAIHETTNELAAQLFPREEIEDRGCVLEVRSGIGGGEATLFAQELFTMYENFVKSKGGSFQITSLSYSSEGGYKEATALIAGRDIFGAIRFESGVHRVQRVPKTETSGRRHTSTAAVCILPEPTEVDVAVEQRDLRVETFKASGAGGQHVNTTESGVRITHIPTGIAIRSEVSRTQKANRELAMKLLLAKMYDIESTKVAKDGLDQRKSIIGKLDYSEKVRTFYFIGDQVMDHRFDLKVPGLGSIMNNAAETGAFFNKVKAAAKVKGMRNAVAGGAVPDYITSFKPKNTSKDDT